MSGEPVLAASRLGKCYAIYRRPIDRLLQMFWRGQRRLYDEYWALRDVDLTIARGESIGIIGRNGAGKSTFLQMVTGTVEPTTGEVVRNGRIAALLELGAGFNPEFTGAENVRLAASLLGLSPEKIEERYDSIIDFAGIGDFLGQPVKFYSSGMYARLAFAVAAHVDADILIIDEILSVGDAAFTQKCMRFIEGFRKRGTILFVSHDTGAMARLCDRVIWLDAGHVRMEGEPREVVEAYLASIYAEADGGASLRFANHQRRALPTPAAAVNNPAPPRVEVFDFDPDSAGFGQGGARIVSVTLQAVDAAGGASLEGGEEVELTIRAQVATELQNPILGFIVKDRLGQVLFNRNTFSSHPRAPRSAQPGDTVSASFRFVLPFLENGDYAVSAAIADGTLADHVQHQWLHDAMFFRVSHADHGRGLIGVPMLDVTMSVDGA